MVVYRTPFLCTKISKLIAFQFKLLHRRLATNTFLTKINIKDNEQCTFCQKEKETLIHLFWTCSETNLFWQDFKQWLTNRTKFSNALNLSPCLVLGLKPDDLHRKNQNFYFLVARFFIWVCKMRNNLPKIENFSPFLSLYNTVKPSLDIHSKWKTVQIRPPSFIYIYIYLLFLFYLFYFSFLSKCCKPYLSPFFLSFF